MKRFNKIYLEISNRCNLRCSFCPGTKRRSRAMTEAEFTSLLPKLRLFSDYLYFHLMGEPLCHPKLETFLTLAGQTGFKVILTTNGTLLSKHREMLLNAPGLHKVNISLHAFEANDLAVPFEEYLRGCFEFGRAVEGKKLVVFRLWNQGGADEKNREILSAMETFFPKPWMEERRGVRVGERIFLEYGDKFDWPDLSAADGGERVFCYGLRDQLGVLCDGTVVPCCLDHEGDLALGNLFEEELEDILEKPRAQAIYQGFRNHTAAEELLQEVRVCKEVFITDYETCTLRPLNAGYAAEIAQWEYSAPYTAYNFKDHPTDYLMDEKTWGTEQFVLCAEDILVGQVACQLYEGRFWVGWSQAPELCGSGGGHLFVKKCVDEIRRVKNFAGTIVLRVAASNMRAIRAYQKAGFVYTETVLDEVAYSDHLEDFWVMEIK